MTSMALMVISNIALETLPEAKSSVFGFPVLVVLGEVEEADLLELGAGVEGGALGDAGQLLDRVEDGVALLLGAAVGHGEDGVGPVLVGGALVAVRDPPDG